MEIGSHTLHTSMHSITFLQGLRPWISCEALQMTTQVIITRSFCSLQWPDTWEETCQMHRLCQEVRVWSWYQEASNASPSCQKIGKIQHVCWQRKESKVLRELHTELKEITWVTSSSILSATFRMTITKFQQDKPWTDEITTHEPHYTCIQIEVKLFLVKTKSPLCWSVINSCTTQTLPKTNI